MGSWARGRWWLGSSVRGGSWIAWTIFRVVEPAQVDRRDREVSVAQLALDDEQRHASARHLDRVSVSQLMRRKASSHTGSGGCYV
jgi:hypothetical protein